MLCSGINNIGKIIHPVCSSDKGGCNGEEFSLFFWDEEMTPEYDIPPCEESVRPAHNSKKITAIFKRNGLETNI